MSEHRPTGIKFVDISNPVESTCINIVETGQIEIAGNSKDRLNAELVNTAEHVLVLRAC